MLSVLISAILFAFAVLGLVFSVLSQESGCDKRLAGKNSSEMTYFVSSGM